MISILCQSMRLCKPVLSLWKTRSTSDFAGYRHRRATAHAAFLAGCFCFLRDLAVAFFFAPVCSKLFCNTETRSITLVGLGAFFGFSSISFPPASTFSSITSISASR